MEKIQQRIFRESFLRKLISDLKAGESLEAYAEDTIGYPEEASMPSSIRTDYPIELFLPEGSERTLYDFENAKKIYEAYRSINETQASDPRLWAYLSHITFRKYTMARWPFEIRKASSVQDKEQAKRFLLAHWFSSGNDRALRRHSLARLWWATHLTYAPWERDEKYFSDLADGNPYKFTKTLLATQDIFQQALERGLGRNYRLLISVLEYVSEHPDISRQKMRSLMIELNLILPVRNISMLPREELKEQILRIGSRIEEHDQL